MDLLAFLSLHVPEDEIGLDYSLLNITKLDSHPAYEFEDIDWQSWGQFMGRRKSFAIYAALLYLLATFVLKCWMDRKAKGYDLKTFLFFWDLSLGLFSVFALYRISPHFFATLLGHQDGLYRSICVSGNPIHQPFWGYMFVYSKFWMFGDTFLLILRKRPLTGLHIYHHCLAMVLAWWVTPFLEPIILYYAITNFAVHSLLYLYFAAKAGGLHPPKWVGKFIVLSEVMQMFIALLVNIYSLVMIYEGVPCRRFPSSIYCSFFVYGTFFILFSKFMIDFNFRMSNTENKKKE